MEILGRQFTELRQEILGHFDAIYHRFERLEQEYHAMLKQHVMDASAPSAVAIRTARAWEGFRHIHRQYLDEVLHG